MRSPQSFDEFRDLIYSMRPRDRYVFEVKDPSEDWGESLEIYFTLASGKGNLYYQMTDSLGKCREGMNKGNKRLALVSDSYLEALYSWLKIYTFEDELEFEHQRMKRHFTD